MAFGGAPPPLFVCYGGGRDSTGLLVGLRQRGIVPAGITFANVGAEKASTMHYVREVMPAWLASVGFPPITEVTYQCGDFKHWPEYKSLEENVLTNRTLPGIAYGNHSCSSKWKITPQDKHLKTLAICRDAWASGQKVRKAIGFGASPHEQKRAKGCSTYAVQDEDRALFDLWFPLQEWGWDLHTCIAEIEDAGLPVPEKSSCYFCTAMKPWEVDALSPEHLRRIVVIEHRATRRNLDYAEAKGWPRGEGVLLTEGLWRRRVKGMRGAIPKPGSMTEYIREKGLLPAAEVDLLIELTPTVDLRKEDIADWQSWLAEITARCQLAISLN